MMNEWQRSTHLVASPEETPALGWTTRKETFCPLRHRRLIEGNAKRLHRPCHPLRIVAGLGRNHTTNDNSNNPTPLTPVFLRYSIIRESR